MTQIADLVTGLSSFTFETKEGRVMSSGLCTNLKCDGINYLCGKCRKMYPCLAASMDEKKRQQKQNSKGGTMGSSNFRSKTQRNDSRVTNHYFNSPGDGAAHGHVKERKNADGSTSYPFIRDVEGNEYDPK